jgi:hypothetical protein
LSQKRAAIFHGGLQVGLPNRKEKFELFHILSVTVTLPMYPIVLRLRIYRNREDFATAFIPLLVAE